MPTSINGIGTTYYGKRNLETETGVCEFCNSHTTLRTYETTHFVIVVFIPIIPLGKKQIIDDCASCGRHHFMPASQWQEVRENAIQASSDQLVEKMDDPKFAIEHLQTLTSFRQMDEARDFAEVVASTHPDNFDIQFYLGSWYENFGDAATADRYFERAFALDPKNPAAIRAKGIGLANEGKVDEANELLAALKPPAKEFDPAVFYQLGNAFQQQQRHDEALEQYKLVADASPEFGRNKEFRKTVKQSEKAAGSSTSILPRQSVFASSAIRWGALLALAIGAFVLGSIFVASSRTIHIVNGCDKDIIFQIDDGDSMTIPALGARAVNLPEGSHEVTMTEPFAEPAKPFNIASSFFTRFFRSPAFILDPTESAAVVWEQTTYAENPIDDYEYDIQIGELLTTYPHIDFQFEPFPDEIELDSRSSQVKRTRVSFQPLTAASFATGDLDIPPQRKMELLERRLTLSPKVEDEWAIYLQVANSNGKEEQAREFVSKFLDVEPLNVAMHRAYQDAMESAGKSDEVLQKYQNLFNENSHDPDYSYLLGRLQKSSSAAREYFEKTLKTNGAHEYALYSLGHIHLAAGDYNAASETLEKSWMLDHENEDYFRYYMDSLFGANDYQKIEEVLAATPRSYDRFKYWANLLKLTGKDVLPLKERFLRTRAGRDNHRYVEFHIAYINKDLGSFSDALLGQGSELEQMVFRIQIAIEAHDLAASEKAFDDLPDYLGNNLKPLLAVLQNRKGDQDEAGKTFDDYLATLDENGSSAIADFCRKARLEEVTVAEFNELPLTISQKRTIGLAILEFSLNQAEEWKDHLKKINFSLSFPHNFIESMLE